MGTMTLPGRDTTLREGVALGLVVATCTWAWLAAVDALAGDPFYTFSVLGGVLAFTIGHYILNLTYGVVLVSAVRGAARAPSLVIAVAFGLVIIEVAFAFATTVLSNVGLGNLAWLRIFIGSLIGAAVAFTFLARRHPLATLLRRAEEER